MVETEKKGEPQLPMIHISLDEVTSASSTANSYIESVTSEYGQKIGEAISNLQRKSS